MTTTPNCQTIESAVLAEFPDAQFGRYNCFAGDVEFITRQGIRTFEDVAGETVTVMAQRRGGGGWVAAPVKLFGEQLTYTITLASSGRTKQLRATSGHRWFVGGKETTTAGLVEGDWLDSVYYRRPTERNVSSVGVQWGLVFGDGTVASRSTRAFIATSQVDTLLPYFGNPRIYKIPDGVLVGDLPYQWKRTMPDIGENQSIIAGFIAGYIAADGRVGANGAVDLYSANPAHLEQVCDLAMSIGIATRPLSVVERLGYGDVPTPMYNLRFVNWTFPPELLIRPEHRGRITARPTRPSRWRVVSVEPYKVEPVFCAVVPEYENFALVDNILTGNCRHIGSNPLRSWSQHAGSEPDRRYFGNALDITHKDWGYTVNFAHTFWLSRVYRFIRNDYPALVDQLLGPGDPGHANHVHVSTWPKMKSNWWYRPPCKGGTLIVIYEDGTKGDTFGDTAPPPPPPTLEYHMAYADTLTTEEWVSTLRPEDITQLFALGVHTGDADFWTSKLAAHPNPDDALAWENFRRTTSARIGFWQPEGTSVQGSPSSYQITGKITPT